MRPILAIVLFALVCISHRIEFADAKLAPLRLVNLERLNLVKRYATRVNDADSDDDGNSSGISSGISSDKSDKSDKSAASSESGSAESTDGTESSSKMGLSTSPPSMTSEPDTTTPCDDADTSASSSDGGKASDEKPPSARRGIIGLMEDGVENYATNIMDGVKNSVVETEAAVTKGVTDMVLAAETTTTRTIKAVRDIMRRMMNTVTDMVLAPYRFITNLCITPSCIWKSMMNFWHGLWSSSGSGAVVIAKRSIRSTVDLSHRAMVSPSHNLLQAIEMLVKHIANAPPKERERIVQFLKNVQCRMSEWYGFGSCTDADADPDLNRPISWQVTMESVLTWIKDHLKDLVDYGLMSEPRAEDISGFCQMMITMIDVLNAIQGYQ